MFSSQSSNPAELPATAANRTPPSSVSARPAAAANPRSGPDRRGIAASVTERLVGSPYFRLRTVWCDYHEGVLCLRGRVPTYYLKQVAQTIACQVDGVEECMNRIEVGPNSPSEKAGAGEKTGN